MAISPDDKLLSRRDEQQLRSNWWVILTIVYTLAVVSLIPIIYWVVMFQLELNVQAEDRFVSMRVIFSGPMLVFLGAFLLIFFRNFANRIFAILFIGVGVAWIIIIVRTIIGESG